MSVKPPTPRLRRALALGTAAAFGLGGLFAAPAFAETAPSDAPTSGATYEANSLEILAADGVEAVGRDADGNIVILATSESEEANAFAAEHDNVVIKKIASGFDSLAATDVVAGAGYAAPIDAESVALCSIGFTGWSPTGEPAVISAGHCTSDGTLSQTLLTVPAQDEAGGGTQPAALSPLGTFGFSQYGGPGNTPGAVGAEDSVDISVIDVTNTTLDLQPKVTDWTNTADLSASATEISAVGAFDPSKPVSKSGRTTGLTTGSFSGIADGWAEVGDNRFVKGFALNLVSDQGDSGGAIFQGETAVGILSGGGETEDGTPLTWAADLQAGLALTGGYTVALALDAPVLTSAANGAQVERGATISGTAPAGSTVTVTPGAGNPFPATVDAAGNWSFAAPTTIGAYSFEVQAKKGFDTSGVSGYTLNVVKAPVAAPAITSPTDGSIVETSLTTITGTGLPLAQISVTGDVTGTAVVGDNGVWSVPADLGYGNYTVSATQTFEEETSPVATSDFTVAPVAPSISTPADGSKFAAGAAPTSSSGVGLAGATVTVTVNGKVVGTDEIPGPVLEKGITAAAEITPAALPGDNWEVALASSIVTGSNVISVTQTVDGITSAAATSTVTLAAVAGPGTPGGNGDGLAVTGAPDMLPIGIAAWLLIAGGIAAAVIVRKRRLAIED